MTDKQLLEQALEALEKVTKEMLAVRDELAENGCRPTSDWFHQELWDSSFDAYANHAMPAADRIRARLKQPKQEPVAWMCHPFGDAEVEYGPYQQCENCMPLYTTPPAAPVQEPVWCNHCNGSGRMVRDPDIGTDQECFVCDGAGVPAAPVQEPPDDELTQALIERDETEAIADELAQAIAQITGADIGEHTSANCPWRRALDAAENWLCHPPAAPVQEPVAWGMQNDDGEIYDCITPKQHAADEGEYTMPLYTTPPAAQRQWVDLTQQDIDIAFDDTQEGGGFDEFARAIEQRLKEKNT